MLKGWIRLQEFQARDYAKIARIKYEQFQAILSVLQHYTGQMTGQRVLDIGCGRTYAFALLFHSLENDVTAIDIDYIGANDPRPIKWWRILKHNGFQKLAEELLYKLLLKDRTFYKALRNVSAFPLTTQGITFKQADAQNMSFADETFDVVISIAVFEHLPNVPQAVSELFRVMKAGALAYIDINLFTSPSGGHHLFGLNPQKVPPWDHLRQKRLPLTCYLNEWREAQYLQAFQERLEIMGVLDIGKGAGRELLTPEIRAELSDYSEKELLKHGIVIIARKRNERLKRIFDDATASASSE